MSLAKKHVADADTLSLVGKGEDFSLVLGGPLYQLFIRAHLSAPPLQLLRRRVLVISLICWLPLLILAALSGLAYGGVAVPFLSDVEVHVRFLAAIPLLIVAEVIVHQRIVVVVRQFVERNIVAAEDRSSFDRIAASTMRLRNSVLFEVLLLIFCFTIGHWFWRDRVALTISTWYSSLASGRTFLTKAGYWYVFVSLPIFRFLLFRWYYRLLLWYRFLWQVRGLPLHLNLYHPDGCGGLGFLASSVPAFAPVLLAQTMLLSGLIGDRIWHAGANLLTFKMEIVGLVIFLMLLVLAPLTFFVVHLERARRMSAREFGILSSQYVNAFRNKWVRHVSRETEPLLGTPDLQSLADLGNSYKSVRDIRLVPFGKNTLVSLGGILLLPLVPLILTIIPLKEIVDWLIKLVF
ncbi:MAG TPA: hypothetical protein VF447_16015 [Terriglobales bacterium]